MSRHECPWLHHYLSQPLRPLDPSRMEVASPCWDGISQGDPTRALIFGAALALHLQALPLTRMDGHVHRRHVRSHWHGRQCANPGRIARSWFIYNSLASGYRHRKPKCYYLLVSLRPTHTYVAIYIYIYMAKASFSAYVLVTILLKLGKRCTFRPKKARPI